MRSSDKPTTMNEMMGKGESCEMETELELSDLPKLLGDKTPVIEYTKVGRMKLINALKQRFGPGYMDIPGISHLLKEFDEELNLDLTIRKNKEA